MNVALGRNAESDRIGSNDGKDLEVLERIVAKLFVENGKRYELRWTGIKQCVAVGIGLHEGIDADLAIRADAVLDDDRNIDFFLESIGQKSRARIDRSAGPVGDNQLDGT